MIKISKIGDITNVKNPINGEWTKMVVVTFVEEGRSGANSAMSETSAFLSGVLGEETGLQQTRTHTHPITLEAASKLKVGDEIPGHINRELYSTPQLGQQQGVDARMIDGQPTYFVTKIEAEEKPDIDRRMSLDVVAQHNPNSVFNARVGVAEVKRERNPQAQQQVGGVGNQQNQK